MFDHDDIEKYEIQEVPQNRDLFLMDEKWMADYEAMLLKGLAGGDWGHPGYISWAAVRGATADGLELSWYVDHHRRFHEIRIRLPRASFVACVECQSYDEKPHIFVKSEWLTDLHLRTNSVFAMVDAINVKKALAAGAITSEHLDRLKDRIDEIAASQPEIAFVSFADSLLLKSNWSVGQWDTPTKNEYKPERIIHVLPEIAAAYRDVLGLEIYGVISQGWNGFYRDELICTSKSGNHISLNSLGLPFAQIQCIEKAARDAIHEKIHEPAQLYMDSDFFHSLHWRYGFEKNEEPSFSYSAPMTDHPCEYFISSLDRVIANLQDESEQGKPKD